MLHILKTQYHEINLYLKDKKKHYRLLFLHYLTSSGMPGAGQLCVINPGGSQGLSGTCRSSMTHHECLAPGPLHLLPAYTEHSPHPPNPNSPRPPSSLLLTRSLLHGERHAPCTPCPRPASFPHCIASTWHRLNPVSGPAATVHPLPPFIRRKALPGGSHCLPLLGLQYLQRCVATAGAPMLEE